MSITSGGDCQWNNVTGAPKMTWDASAAMLGIGTSVPAARLHVAGVSGTNNILSLVPDGYAGQLFGASISGVTNGFTVTNRDFIKMRRALSE